jgi:hypothetical protein
MSVPTPITDPITLPGAAAPWYTSSVQIAQVVTAVSALVAIFPKIASTFGLTSLDKIQATVTAVFGTIAFLAPIIGIAYRAVSKLQPLTLTKGSAEAHPATIAAVAAADVQRSVSIAPEPEPAPVQAAAPASIPIPGKPWGK